MVKLSSSLKRSKASFLTSHQIFLSIVLHFSDINSLFMPGAIFIPIMAASISIVPDPHIGSTRVLPGLQGVR